MSSPKEKLADSLEQLKRIQETGRVAIRSKDFSRSHRETLVRNGFLREIMKGWYLVTSPAEVNFLDNRGATTQWYSAFWEFCSDYCNDRFGNNWCLSPEQSISIHVGNRTVPHLLQVRSPQGANKPTPLLHGCTLFDTRLSIPDKAEVTPEDRLRIYDLPSALIDAVPRFFIQNPTDATSALASFQDASKLLPTLLRDGRTTIAGRLAGAFRKLGRTQIADEISQTMQSAGYEIREVNPFLETESLTISSSVCGPYEGRIRLMWEKMRKDVIANFPKVRRRARSVDRYLKSVEEVYASDAYHSLSIEGYRVSPSMIERVRGGAWNPDINQHDRQQYDAMAARGYYQSFQKVKESVREVLSGSDCSEVARSDHRVWYREMFSPLVSAGFQDPASLAGYRNGRVFLLGSRHVPVSGDSVGDLMWVYFDLLRSEKSSPVRVVLGHFMFVYIHPYMDGNGRMGRFMMNLMLADGGYRWLVIPVEQRERYMVCLEAASVDQDIVPFTKFLADLMNSP